MCVWYGGAAVRSIVTRHGLRRFFFSLPLQNVSSRSVQVGQFSGRLLGVSVWFRVFVFGVPLKSLEIRACNWSNLVQRLTESHRFFL